MIKVSQFTLGVYLCALSIRERLRSVSRIRSVYGVVSFQDKVNYWKLQVGEISDEFFEKRLKWSDIKHKILPKLLNPIKSFNSIGNEFPEWALFLDEFLKYKNKTVSIEYNRSIPFFHLLTPLVNFLSSKISYNSGLMGDVVIKDLKHELLVTFSKLASQSLLEFMHNEACSYGGITDFIIKDNYKKFFSEYSYLSRLLFTRGIYWINNTNLLLHALEKDISDISAKLKVPAKDIEMLGVSADLSESHNRGKNVAILKTNKGNFVFKNRSTSLEKSFYELAQTINREFRIKQYIPWLIDRGDYGWMEYIEQQKCGSKVELERYFERAGSLLCLFYLLGATDLHSENMISKGEFPVFIDLETLLNPLAKLNNKHLNSLNEFIDIKYGLSVSRVGILPQWLIGPDTGVYNNSALGGSKKDLKYPLLVWTNINTDNINCEYVEAEPPDDKNLVYLHSVLQQPLEYSSQIIAGFSDTYRYLLAKRKNKNFIKALNKFKNRNSRFVFRATKVYTLLLDYLNHPDYMRDGVSRSLEFEILAKGLILDLEKKYIFWEVLEDELEQLENNDVPYFTVNTSSTSLESLNSTLYKDAFQYKGYDRLRLLLKDLNEVDLHFQLGLIKNSVETDRLKNIERVLDKLDYSVPIIPEEDHIKTVLLDIKNRIMSSRIEIDNRSTWIGYVSNVVSHTFGYKPIGIDTANGNMGVAIFLGAMYAKFNDLDCLGLIKSTILPIVDVLKENWSKKEFMLRFGIGGTTGIGSVIYGFIKLFEFTQDPSYLGYAFNFVDLISDYDIKKSLRQDVVSGNAGLLLSLIKLYEVTKKNYLKNIMQKCYLQIIKTGYPKEVFVNWDYQQNKKLLGFSHGSSGVFYALSRYLPYCKDEIVLQKLLKEILLYEDKYFDKNQCNWPDYRFDEVDLGVASWCHGATGIGMSRLDLLNISLTAKYAIKDITRSLEKTISTGQHQLDTVCCGNSGRIDFILELRNTDFYNKKLENYLFSLINNLLERYKVNKDFNYFLKVETSDINVGFYQGLSGIGYQLIRFLESDKYQSILLFK